MFQIFSRNNDSNGNGFSLALVYGNDGVVREVYEERSSMPNIRRTLTERGLMQLPSFHLSPSEYNATKNAYKSLLKHV